MVEKLLAAGIEFSDTGAPSAALHERLDFAMVLEQADIKHVGKTNAKRLAEHFPGLDAIVKAGPSGWSTAGLPKNAVAGLEAHLAAEKNVAILREAEDAMRACCPPRPYPKGRVRSRSPTGPSC